FFGVSERTMIKLLREERIPARKVGREWRFSRTALLRWLGDGDSVNYLNQTELYRVADDTKAEMPDLLKQIEESLEKLKDNGGNMRELLPEMEKDVYLPENATLRVSYKRQRDIEKLTFKLFWFKGD
ncbi:MAG: helix-turn-helix domain-containing protein, partial [Euryarchaeota archaeon]|nr:helix-turn-helix domain-containing protein [Euryarchaeota archaeon]